MVKKIPLLVIPNNLVWSGTSVSKTPDENDTKSMTMKAGKTLGSKTSTHLIFNNLKEKGSFCSFGSVSFMFNNIKIEPKAQTEEV